MADIIDRAQDQQQRLIDESISRAKQNADSKLSKGKCNYCGEQVAEFFCDDDCKNDYEYEQKIRARQRGEKW